MKLNLFRFNENTNTNLFENELNNLKIKFPVELNVEIINKLLKKDDNNSHKVPFGMYS